MYYKTLPCAGLFFDQVFLNCYNIGMFETNTLEPLSTSKTRVFVKRFDGVSIAQWQDMAEWCYNNLYHGGHYEPNWSHQYPTFYFTDEKEYLLFCLRWS